MSELCSINLSDIDFGSLRCKVLGKGNKERYVYFTARTMVRLQEYFKTRKDIQHDGGNAIFGLDTPLFATVDKRYKRVQKSGIECLIKKIGRISGVTRLHPHLLRATFATNLAKRGVALNVIAKALGHADLQTISKYVLLTDEVIKDMMRANVNVA